MPFSVHQHLLHQNSSAVRFVDTPNKGGNIKPTYLIMHYTAGTTADGAISWFRDPQAQASAHLVVDRDGTVTQMAAFNRKAWHAGRSRWADIVGLNGHSVGIEIVNAGKLQRNEKGQWINWSGKVIPPEQVTVATHKDESSPAGWHIYTPEQLEVVTEIGTALHEKYKFIDVLGHDDISPKRKVDPGPAFPMISIRSRIMGRDEA